MKSKKELRKSLLSLRDKLTEVERSQSSKKISHSLSKIIQKEKGPIAFYLPIRDEYDPTNVIKNWLKDSKQNIACLPVIVRKNAPMIFRKWTEDCKLTEDLLNLSVPEESADVLLPSLVIVPTLGFDCNNFRLGYGGGYYDRTLSGLDSLNVVVCFSIGKVQRLTVQEYDIALDYIISG